MAGAVGPGMRTPAGVPPPTATLGNPDTEKTLLYKYASSYDPDIGPLIPVWVVRHDRAWLQPGAGLEVSGLLDTGAARSYISQWLADRLQLEQLPDTSATALPGALQAAYLAKLVFYQDLSRYRLFHKVTLGASTHRDPEFDMWIGRDILGEGQLVMGEHHWGKHHEFQFELQSH